MDVKKYALILAVAWTMAVGASMIWNYFHYQNEAQTAASLSAREQFANDIIYRRWNAGYGGVYVPISESTQPNPYLTQVFERDIETPSGRKLTLINPAYMTRQVHKLGFETEGVIGHITSLNPIRPANSPDAWEKRALETFESGGQEFSSIELFDNESHLRLMRPLKTEIGCLKCHAQQGYKEGDVRGGISVSIPMAPHLVIAHENLTFVIIGHGALWILGLVALAFGASNIQRRILERKQAENSLRESELMYRSSIENASGVPYQLDRANNKYCFIGAGIKDLVGIEQDEFSPQIYNKIIIEQIVTDPDGLEDHVEYGEAFWHGEVAQFKSDICIRTSSGEVKWISDSAVPILDNSNKIIGSLGILLDITERKQAEEANVQLSRAIEQADETIIITDVEGTIQYANPAFEKTTGYTVNEAIGQNPRILKSGQHDNAFYKKMWETLSSSNEWSGEIINKKKDGTLFTENVVISPVFDSNGEIVNYVAAKNDITETKRLQELEARAGRLETAGTIAGQVAHDFNNLLAPLIAFPEFIRDELPKNHTSLKYIDQMETAAQKIADINQDLLAMGRRGHYNHEIINLNTVIQQAVAESEPFPETMTCEQDLDENLMDISGGGAQIHRVLNNMLNNAQDAMQNIGQIIIKTENYYVEDVSVAYERVPKGEYVKLTISDTGCGIPENIKQKIFDPFFTSKTTDKKRGSGLGMSVVDAVIKDHKGYIDLDSKIGEGTSFYLYFPITRESKNKQQTIDIYGGNETVLIVDDDEVQRQVSAQILKKLGYQITTVNSGEKAISLVENKSFDLLVLDMIMPDGIDGAETYRRILEISPDQKAIIVSGFSESKRVIEAQKLGVGVFVQKPLTKEAIASAVRNELDKREEIPVS